MRNFGVSMNAEERSEAVYQWQQKLCKYVGEHTPAVALGESHFERLDTTDEGTLVKWAVEVSNQDVLDVNCWSSFDFFDTSGSEVMVSNAWKWFPDERCQAPYARMDRRYQSSVPGKTTHAISGFIKMPAMEAELLVDLVAWIEKAEFDIYRFEVRWEPHRAVVSDKIEKDGKLVALRVRDNIFNKEYCTICLTPVVRILDAEGTELKSVTCREWCLRARHGGTFQKYVRLSRKHAEVYKQHRIEFTNPRFRFEEDETLLREERLKGGIVETSDGRRGYEVNSHIWNDGFEWAATVINYSRFYNLLTPLEPLESVEVTIAPRNYTLVSKQFFFDDIHEAEFISVQVEPVLLSLGDFYELA